MHKQLKFKIKTWGGKRKGAGRPNRSKTVNHMAREQVDFRKPLHITLKLREGLPNLRTKRQLQEFKNAAKEAKRFELHVLHFAILSNHIHMIVETKDNRALANGMRSLGCRLGKSIRRRTREQGHPRASKRELVGSVFQGRYHLEVIRSTKQMRNTLEYVLLNHSKHQKLVEHLDLYSSAFEFKHWPELMGRRRMNSILKHQIEKSSRGSPLATPRSWLAREGWRRGPAV